MVLRARQAYALEEGEHVVGGPLVHTVAVAYHVHVVEHPQHGRRGLVHRADDVAAPVREALEKGDDLVSAATVETSVIPAIVVKQMQYYRNGAMGLDVIPWRSRFFIQMKK